MRIMALTPREQETISSICDTLIPSLPSEPNDSPDTRAFYSRAASDIGVDKALAQIIDETLEPGRREEFRRLLSTMDSRFLNLFLSGRPSKYLELGNEEKERYLASWRDSRIGSKRSGFQALKRLACFLAYTLVNERGSNPNWKEIGYPGPSVSRSIGESTEIPISQMETPENGAATECDVVIVGSGAGGSVVAYELSKRKRNVIVVESGPHSTAKNFDQKELSMMNRLFEQHGAAATKDLSIALLAGIGSGGGTTVNWMTCIRPPASVLRNWELEFGIGGLTGGDFKAVVEEVWSTLKVNRVQSQLNYNNEALFDGCRALGYNEGTDYEIISRNAVGCRERCAFCTFGCVYSCKQSTMMNYLPMAYKNGARFIFDAKVERVIVDGGIAKGVSVRATRDSKPVEFQIKARIVVLACGSIRTPALLLNSGIRGKNIGRHLRLHPTTAVSGFFDNKDVRA